MDDFDERNRLQKTFQEYEKREQDPTATNVSDQSLMNGLQEMRKGCELPTDEVSGEGVGSIDRFGGEVAAEDPGEGERPVR